MSDISTADLTTAQPEWANAAAGALSHAVAMANSLDLSLYTNATQEKQRRLLEAGSVLYQSPFGRDMFKSAEGFAPSDPYRAQARRMDRLKGTAYRDPHFDLPSGVS